MPQIITSIEIAASAEAVWQHLTDFAAYPSWNPFIRSISGPLERGAQLEVTVQPTGGSPMSFKPRLLACNPGAELRWKGMFLVPGLFDGEHYFQITESKTGQVLFTHGETFSGLLTGVVLQGKMKQATEAGFEQMNRALKSRAQANGGA
jgi:hypothetical protein